MVRRTKRSSLLSVEGGSTFAREFFQGKSPGGGAGGVVPHGGSDVGLAVRVVAETEGHENLLVFHGVGHAADGSPGNDGFIGFADAGIF